MKWIGLNRFENYIKYFLIRTKKPSDFKQDLVVHACRPSPLSDLEIRNYIPFSRKVSHFMSYLVIPLDTPRPLSNSSFGVIDTDTYACNFTYIDSNCKCVLCISWTFFFKLKHFTKATRILLPFASVWTELR